MEVNTAAMGECLGLSRKRVSDLTNDGVLVKIRRGIYDLGPSVQGYIEWRVSGASSSKTGQSLDQVKAEHEVLKMRKTELSLRLMEGKLHRAEDVQQVWTSMAAAVKSRLLGIPVKAAPQVAGMDDAAEIQKVLSREVADALNEVADYDPADFADPMTDDPEEDDDDGEAPD